MRWPGTWSDVSLLTLLRETPINYILVQDPTIAARLQHAVESQRLQVTIAGSPPAGIEMIEGDWPGIKPPAPGQNPMMVAGPTGEPWIDSNGWKVALAQALHPGRELWVDVVPSPPRVYAESYVIAVCDAGAHGASWVIGLDDALAAKLAAGDATALALWKKATQAAGFFAGWSRPEMLPAALIGVVSDFSGDNEYMSHEVLNLLARNNQQMRVLPLAGLTASSLNGLRAVIYADVAAPEADVRKLITDFVEQGGILLAGPGWGAVEGTTAPDQGLPRYDVRKRGKGCVAIAHKPLDDPYLVAQDAGILMSHRYDLLRIWNGGAVRACLARGVDGKRGLLQLVFYSNAREGDPSVRVAGPWRRAKLLTLDTPEGRDVPLVPEEGAAEVHLPAVRQYAAVELEA